ncbi:MAG: S-layer homology domain-containing protein, partial [Patescibacteria group bacterium]
MGVRRGILFIGTLLVVRSFAFAQEALPSFTDVPETREEFGAIEDLRERGIIEGRPDGSFGPEDFVNRAEAVTIVVRAVANVKNLPTLGNCFPDVRGKDWYVRPVCYAKDLEWVGGYPDGTFQPIRTVSKGEFLKILLNAYGTDLELLATFGEPVALDAQDTTQWYFPYLSYALASSMTIVDRDGNLHPGASLTRGQVALLIHRFLLYREGQRNDTLVENALRDVERALDALPNLDT